jgi:filamentous hemagglutinin family protein
MMLQMSRFVLLLPSLVLLGLLHSETVQAQVSADGTLSTTVTSADPRNFVIEQGDRAGGNLFHSFRQFSVPTGGSAYFNNAVDVQNIFARVTGGNSSNIDGLIRANGTANLFLLNPSGILFGPNARLNIGGSFIGTTANSIRFADGVEFSATHPSEALLTVSTLIGLQMGQNPGTITVQNTGHRLIANRFAPPKRGTTSDGLKVTANHTLGLIGGEIRLEGGVLTAPSSHIELGSASDGVVNLNLSSPMWGFDYTAVQQLGDIRFLRQALVDASGDPAGSIHLQGRDISLDEGSVAFLNSLGNQDSGDIIVNASESFELRGVGSYGFTNSFLQTNSMGNGAGGDLVVSAPQVLLQDGARILAQSASPGTGGNVFINAADSLQLQGISSIEPSLYSALGSVALSAGRGGNVRITTRHLRVQGGTAIINSTRGTGTGGNGVITASELIEIIGENPTITSSLAAVSFNRGNASQLTVNTPRLRVQDGGSVVTSTLGVGNAGSLRVNADEIMVSGRGAISGLPSRIGARAEILPPNFQQLFHLPAFPTGNSGSLIINTSQLQITDGAIVGVDHAGVGNAGDLRLNADTILLDRAGSITASTRSGGGGNIDLHTNALTLRHGSTVLATAGEAGNGGQIAIAADTLDLLGNSRIGTQAQGSGNAGTLNLQVDRLTLHQGQIGVESQGSGNAGRLTIDANSVQLSHSLINASTQTGQGGDVQLQVRDRLQLADQSQILANAQQSGRGGNIRITAVDTALQDSSRISTNARGSAVGGELQLEGDRFSLSSGSQITASTAGSGRAGSLNIHATDGISLSGRNTRLAAASTTNAAAGSIFLQTPDLQLSDRAAISVSGAGRGGAGDLTIQANMIDLDQQAALEAQVAGGNQGNITLNANALLLRNRSTINTNATGTASGGNIRFNGNCLVGLDNSDIVARAQAGAGGNINIAADTVVGIAPRDTLTPDSDINASSQLGLNGSVSLSNPEVQPDSGLVELPENLVDASQQVAQTCAATSASRFVATGRGGIPENPTQALSSDRTWNDIRDLSAYSSAIAGAIDSASLTVQSPIREATGFTVNSQGQVELVATSESSRPSNPAPATCSPPPVQ